MDQIPLRLIGGTLSLGTFKDPTEFRVATERFAQWADADGWEAILIYTDHKQLDPWLVAQLVIESTTQLRPLVAVQPLYMHPFTVAQKVMSLALLYGRQVYLNMVAGGFPRDLESLGDRTPHDRRYDRLTEYASVVMSLLSKQGLTSFSGEFYQVSNLQLPALVSEELRPAIMVSGSSEAGLTAARRLGARAIQYLRPPDQYTHEHFPPGLRYGTRLGIIVRDSTEEAWAAAFRRYPPSDYGTAVRDYAVQITDSVWVKELGKDIRVPPGHPYWLGAYKSGQASSPFLVGTTDDVAAELATYIRYGLTTFLLEVPESAEDSRRITQVFDAAKRLVHVRAKAADMQAAGKDSGIEGNT